MKKQLLESIKQLKDDIQLLEKLDNQEFSDVIGEWHLLCNAVKKSVHFKNDKKNWRDFELNWGAQSIQFMVDCVPEIHRVLLKYYRRKDELSFLDVGSGSGAGANLIAQLHSDRMIYSKINVDAIDHVSKRLRWAKSQYPNINYFQADLFKLPPKNWDIVVCSHCVEHVINPKEFCQQIINVCKGFAFIYTPYDEVDRIPGHLNTIDKRFYRSFKVEKFNVFNSMAWHADKPKDKCILTVIDCRL